MFSALNVLALFASGSAGHVDPRDRPAASDRANSDETRTVRVDPPQAIRPPLRWVAPRNGSRGTADTRAGQSVEARPAISWQAFGRSVEGRPIELARFGRGPHQVLIVGPLHGEDPAALAFVEELAAELDRVPSSIEGATVTVVKDPNPDGRARRRRENARGVDLNRNFATRNWRSAAPAGYGTPGPAPASEPETRALAELIATIEPRRVILIRSYGAQPAIGYAGPAGKLAATLAAELRVTAASREASTPPGSLISYVGLDRRTATVLVTVPRGPQNPALWRTLRTTVISAARIEERQAARPLVPVAPSNRTRQSGQAILVGTEPNRLPLDIFSESLPTLPAARP